MIENDGLVRFSIGLNKNVDSEAVKVILLQLGVGGIIHIEIPNYRYLSSLNGLHLFGEADQKTYEAVFGAKVEWQEKEIHNLNHPSRKVSDWFEHKAPEIPEILKNEIKYVEVSHPMYLTD